MNPTADRLARALFVALAVGLAWSIRGDFGGTKGAMYPGAILGLGFAYVSGDQGLFRRMAWLAILGMLLVGMGGSIPYGVLHGYAKSDTFINFTYGYFTLLLDGGVWGLFGGAAIALVMEQKRPRLSECLLVMLAVILFGYAFMYLLAEGLGLKVNPPPPGTNIKDRGDVLLAFVGGAILFCAWLWKRGYHIGLCGAFFGFIGFATGMYFGRFLGNASIHLPGDINHWNVGEVSAGFFGGLVYTFGMLPFARAEYAQQPALSWRTALCMLFTVAFIPLNHFKGLSQDRKRDELAASLAEWGYADPQALASTIYSGLAAVAIAGIAIAAIWAWIHTRNKRRFAWVPVLSLSLVMLLFQNLHALYFWYPPRAGYINMHHLLWLFMVLMILYIALRRGHEPLALPQPHPAKMYAAWTAAFIALFGATLLLSLGVNGEESMQSANTRFPLWSWEQGPFPRSE